MDHFTFLCVNLFSAVLLVCWRHLKKSDKSGIFATIPSFYRSICLRVCIFKLLFIFHWDVIGQMETVLLKHFFFNLDYFSWSRFWPGLWRLFTCIEHMYNICHHHIRFYSDNLHRNFFPPATCPLCSTAVIEWFCSKSSFLPQASTAFCQWWGDFIWTHKLARWLCHIQTALRNHRLCSLLAGEEKNKNRTFLDHFSKRYRWRNK